MIFKEVYNAIRESAFGFSIGAMWQHLAVYMQDMDEPYEVRKETFFMILETLLKEGHVKFANNDVFMAGTVKEQLQAFRDIWPPYPSEDEFDDLDDIGMWFFAKAPAGIVWITSEGQGIWA